MAFVNGNIYSCGADDKLRVLHSHSGKIIETLQGEAAGQARRLRSATGVQPPHVFGHCIPGYCMCNLAVHVSSMLMLSLG